MEDQVISSFAADDPREARRAMRDAAARGPTAIDLNSGMLIVLHYRDVERLLLETKLVGVGLSLFEHMGIAEGPLRDWYGALMFTNEGRPHHRLRSLVGKAFSPRSVESLRPIARAIIAERLERIRALGQGDLVEALADVPMRVMCALLGVPGTDVPSFIAWVDALSPTFGFMTETEIEAATVAIGQLLDYTNALRERRAATPASDLISALIAAEHEGDRLTSQETSAMVANLLVGGHDTTSGQIGCTLFTLLRRPEILAEVRADAALIPGIVNETIRLEPSIGMAPRTVAEPIEINGRMRPAGTMIGLSTMTANADPSIWRDPDAFDARRFADPAAPKVLTFGGGPHHCLGTWLARLTIEETVRAVADLSPTLNTAPDEIPWVSKLGTSPASLPVRMTGA